MKRLLIFAVFLLSNYAFASSNVLGRVVQQKGEQAVEMATIQLFHATSTDSSFVKGVQTNTDGDFIFDNIPSGKYKLLVSCIGYQQNFRYITITDTTLLLPTIRLKEDVQFLSEVTVQGHAAEMTVKGDTIEYNTAAYKMHENAMVEDLLKKMNGVEIDQDGKVKVNGEEIKAIQIDGKHFFGKDVQAATKNIPAEMIEKVQVLDEKSDMAKLTGFEDDETERIINLTLKANRKKGVFGSYNLGLGMDMFGPEGKFFSYPYSDLLSEQAKQFFSNDFRYNGSLFTNILLGESQTTIMGNANNTNEMRSGRGYHRFGSGMSSGITWGENFGVNTNIDFTKKIKKIDNQTSLLFGANVTFNHSINNTDAIALKESYSNGLSYHNNDTSHAKGINWDVQAQFELEYQIDTLNRIIIKPSIGYSNQNTNNLSQYDYYRMDTLINDGSQIQGTSSNETKGDLRIIYNHKFLKPGRSITLNLFGSINQKEGHSNTEAFDHIKDSTLINQYNLTQNQTYSYSIKASYVEPIYGKNHLLETALTLSGNNRHSFKNQYDFDTKDSIYSFNPYFSNELKNTFISEILELNYRWIEQNFDLVLGARINPSQTLSQSYYGGTLLRDTTINVWNFAPNASFKYKFGKKEFARVIYRGYSSQPSIQQMEPVRNNSDAMNESVGNMGLNPSFRHFVRVMYSRFNEKRFSSIMTGLRANVTKDAFVNNTVYDETGKRYTQTVNAQGIPWDIGADFMYNTPFANKLLQFNTRTAINYNERLAYINRAGQSHQIIEAIEKEQLALGAMSKTGNLMFNEDLGIRLTHKIVDFGLRGRISYSRTFNNVSTAKPTNNLNWTITGDIQLHMPKDWEFAADCSYTARYGYRLDDVNEIILNASLNKTWKNATLTLKVYDILQSKKNIVQIVGEDYIQYKKTNTLPTYFTLSFSYKFNKMGNNKASGMAGHMQDMIESGRRPGRPMGPPPTPR